MPKFMDSHDDLKLPAQAWASLAESTRAGATDEFGVRQIEAYHNQDGQVYCLVDAPDAEAVRKHHTALGVACGEVHPVESLL
ncbi:MAG TPA: nickel-binding protein [Verrucomicrobiae bacterium]|nr:nickel-binding protein [Verrucomicrobiae bacterium]